MRSATYFRFNNNPPLGYNPKEKYIFCPDIFRIGHSNDKVILFLPLLKTVCLVSNPLYNLLNERKNYKEYMKEVVESGILIKRNVKLKPSSSKLNTNNVNACTFLITNECNLKCVYCYARYYREKKRTLDINSIFKVLKKIKFNRRKVDVYFHGPGEPTLELGIIKRIVKFFKSKVRHLEFIIQTNGLINSKQLDFLVKNKFRVGFSIDGPPFIQNKQRPNLNGKGYIDIIENNLRRMKENANVRATVSLFSVDFMLHSVQYFSNFNVKRIHFEPVIQYEKMLFGDYIKKADFCKPPKLDNFCDNLLRCTEIADLLGIHIYSSYLINPKYVRQHVCGAKTPSIAFTPEGDLSSCYECFKYEKNNPFFFGSYKNGELNFDGEKISYLQSKISQNISPCKYCFLKWNCAGGCPKQNYNLTGDIFKPSEQICKIKRCTTKKLIEYHINLRVTEIKPHFRVQKKEKVFSMFFNDFVVNEQIKALKNKKALESYLITITNQSNFDEIFNLLIRFKKGVKDYKPFLILLSPKINNKNKIEPFLNFIKNLQKNRFIYFVIKPIPRCLFGTGYGKTIEEHKIPNGCKECLELFTVKDDGSIVFCNGQKGRKKINEYEDRDEIFKEFRTNLKFLSKCNSCIYKIRKKCGGFCL